MSQQTVVIREIGDVYVQNPVSGEYLLAQMDTRAERAIDGYLDAQERSDRKAGL